MEHIKEYRKINAKVEMIEEKLKFKKDLLEFDKRLLNESTKAKIDKYIEKENKKLYPLVFALQDVNKEVNLRLPFAMRRFNTKDYWLRREAIQTWRVAGKTSEATKIYYDRLNELDEIKRNKENSVKEKIYNRISKFVAVTDEEKTRVSNQYQQELEISKKNIELFTQKANEEQQVKLEKLFAKYEKDVNKLNVELEKHVQIRDTLKTESYQLEDDIVLKVENLTMQFGGLKAVDNLSFKVRKGEIFGLIGPNGAGKTTVFNCITQFYKPTKGDLYFLEKNGSTISLNDYVVHDVIKKGIVRTFQNVEVIKEVSVLDNLLIAAHTQYRSNLFEQFLHLPILKKEEQAIKEKALYVLEFMGLTNYKDWLAFGLPYGVLKKVEIARTLMNNPQLIILDEPAAGLNDSETAELTKLIRKIQKEFRCTILLVEHDMGLVMDICDTICAISFGKLLAIGTPSEIQNNKDVQAAYLGVSEED